MRNTHKKNSEEAWENRELGSNEAFVRKASSMQEKALDEKLELQIISIRLQKSLIDDLKEIASESGLRYQPYIRHLLTQHVRSERRKREKHVQVVKR
jgi:predicted DNA binding CopG/RHH family protein